MLSKFIEDGYELAVDANEPVLRERLERRCQRLFDGKSYWQRRQIRHRMEGILERLLDKVAPPDALY